MQVGVTALLDEIDGLLARGPYIVSLYQQKDASFIPALNAWLLDSEAVLRKGRRPQVGAIAGVRAQLLSASHGVYEKANIAVPSTGGPRKIYHAIAALLFDEAQHTLNDVYSVLLARKEEAGKYVQQMIMISLQKGSFYPIWNSGLDVSQKLINLWMSFQADPDLVQGTRQVLASVHFAGRIAERRRVPGQ